MTGTIHDHVRAFAERYDYDASYLLDLHARSPAAFAAVSLVQQLAGLREALPADAHAVACVAAMRSEGCTACTELNFRMAEEAGVSPSTLDTLRRAPDTLPDPLGDVYRHATAVASGGPVDVACADRIESRFGPAALAELAVVVAGCRVYPTVKRGLLVPEACEVIPRESR